MSEPHAHPESSPVPAIPRTALLLSPLQNHGSHPHAAWFGEYADTPAPYEPYVLRPLRRIFAEVEACDYLERLLTAGPLAVNREICEHLVRFRPDYLIWNTYNHEIGEEVFAQARAQGTTVVAIMFDDEYRFDNYSRGWVPYVDFFITNDPQAVGKYRALGARAVFTTPLSGEQVLEEWTPAAKSVDVAFIGRPKKDRLAYVQALEQAGIRVELFGKAGGRYLSWEEMNAVIRRSRIVLNFSKSIRSDRFGVKGRLFETCLAGGFLLTEYFPGLEEYYAVDREIGCFCSAEELVRKVRHYLEHETEREAIAEAGWRRAQTHYTATTLLGEALAKIEAARATVRTGTGPEAMAPGLRRAYARHNLAIGRGFLAGGALGLAWPAVRLAARYRWLEPELWVQLLALVSPGFVRRPLVRMLAHGKTGFKRSVLGQWLRRRGLVHWLDDSE